MLAAVVLATHGIGLLALGAIGATAVAPPTFLPIHIVALAATTAAAPQAVARWRFVPAREGDRPVEAWVRVPIEFKLGGS